jgi:hypothetical protein
MDGTSMLLFLYKYNQGHRSHPLCKWPLIDTHLVDHSTIELTFLLSVLYQDGLHVVYWL